MENSSAASASSEAGSSRSQEIEELERFIDSYVLEYQVQGLLADKTEGDGESEQTQSHISQVSAAQVRGPWQTRTCFQIPNPGSVWPPGPCLLRHGWPQAAEHGSRQEAPLLRLYSIPPGWAAGAWPDSQFIERVVIEFLPCARHRSLSSTSSCSRRDLGVVAYQECTPYKGITCERSLRSQIQAVVGGHRTESHAVCLRPQGALHASPS